MEECLCFAKHYAHPLFPGSLRALAMDGRPWFFLDDVIKAARMPPEYFRLANYQKHVKPVVRTADLDGRETLAISLDGVMKLHAHKGIYVTPDLLAWCERVAAKVMRGKP